MKNEAVYLCPDSGLNYSEAARYCARKKMGIADSDCQPYPFSIFDFDSKMPEHLNHPDIFFPTGIKRPVWE